MDGLTKEIEEVTKNKLTKAQKENLEKAHRLYPWTINRTATICGTNSHRCTHSRGIEG